MAHDIKGVSHAQEFDIMTPEKRARARQAAYIE
jgi:hypothetical protein